MLALLDMADAIAEHPMASRIALVQGSSIEPSGIKRVHVLAELDAHAGLASVGRHCVVSDTVVGDMPKDLFPDRPREPGNNPRPPSTRGFAITTSCGIDLHIPDKLRQAVAPDG